jgi:HAD superfamily hydrolase (TIGR01509 family)
VGRIRAVVFDFDGLILDTEQPSYQSWAEVWEAHGCTLEPDEWASCIGTRGAFDPYGTLVSRAAVPVAPEAEVRAAKRAREAALLERAEPLPGVVAWLEQADRLGLAVGLASSSSPEWIEHHLGRLGLRRWFTCVACWEGQCPPKPAPDLYRAACEGLGVGPEESIAVEDSPHGIAAARAAGLWCLAVPNDLTRALDLSAAHLVVRSLAHVDLAEVVAAAEASSPG